VNGRAIAQAVSPWLHTAAARVQTRVQSCGICGGQSGAGARLLRVLRFSLPIFIPPISPQSPSPIIRGWYNRSVVAAVPKVPPHKLKKKKGQIKLSILNQVKQVHTLTSYLRNTQTAYTRNKHVSILHICTGTNS
jgi:hypothetical protein